MLRVIGYLLLPLGLGLFGLVGWVLAQALGTETALASATGLWWFQTHPDSLQLLQPAIERHVSVSLYENVVQPLLEAPLGGTLAILAGFGVVLVLLGFLFVRPRRPSR